MTGAQEQALMRVKKRQTGLVVHKFPELSTDDVEVSFVRRSEWEDRVVDARITPEGRVVEKS